MAELKELQNEIERQLAASSWFGKDKVIDFTHAVLGLTEEAGELAGLCKRVYFRGKDRTDEEWKSELGDVLWYLVAACSIKGFSLDDIWQYNCLKLDLRHQIGRKGRDTWEG